MLETFPLASGTIAPAPVPLNVTHARQANMGAPPVAFSAPLNHSGLAALLPEVLAKVGSFVAFNGAVIYAADAAAFDALVAAAVAEFVALVALVVAEDALFAAFVALVEAFDALVDAALAEALALVAEAAALVCEVAAALAEAAAAAALAALVPSPEIGSQKDWVKLVPELCDCRQICAMLLR